jgi:arylsulfatase A-like enzyme
VPAIIRYPGLTEPGTTSDVPVIGTDLFVTLTAIGGGVVPADRPIDGVDIQPVLKGGTLPERAILWALSSVSENEFAVRRGDWKLLLDKKYEPKQLFNLREDPLELFNLLDENPRVVNELSRDLELIMSNIRSDPYLPDTEMRFRFAQ